MIKYADINKMQNIYLKQTSTAIVGAALTVEYFSRYTPYVIVIVPGQFGAGTDVR